jgi:hypothetical protein
MSEPNPTAPPSASATPTPAPTLIQQLETRLRAFATEIEADYETVLSWVKAHL